jgi:hypothetical protein
MATYRFGVRALSRHLLLLLAPPLGACGSGDALDTTPHLVPGGAVGGGPIAGRLSVYVTDDDTRAPVAGATVRVGPSAAAAPCTALTDSTGLAAFTRASCSALDGKQDVTASAPAYVPTTWIGVAGASLTMTIRANPRPAAATATASGTIAGWQGLPAPAAGHNTLGVVGFSQTRQLGDRANDVTQGTRQVVTLAGPFAIPANACVRNALVDDCNWQLTTRIGPQAHYAIILDQDTHGTPDDSSDDTFSVMAWALQPGLTFAAGDSVSGESLPLLADADLQTVTVALASPPPGLDAVTAFPLVDLGADGRIPAAFPALDLSHTTTRLPRATGALAAARYDLLAQAQDAKDKAQPATLAWLHGLSPAATVAQPGWLAPPAGITASAGSYGFAAVAGATLYGAELQTIAGDRAWSVTLFDGAHSFTLPGLAPDPLPAGMVRLVASALQIPGVDPGNVAFDDARDRLTGLSSDALIFTR